VVTVVESRRTVGEPAATLELARRIVAAVPDPELPMLTLADLGIVRDVEIDDATVRVEITPTYTGCPALHEMRHDICRHLLDAGFSDVRVQVVLAPAWTTDWITEDGRRKLLAAGIAPPGPAPRRVSGPIPLTLTASRPVPCPRCASVETERTAAFGPTACRALHRCRSCGEPFEHVKEI
jgi:ring-1,2-phenylacetyl-CoA epoxidase subunit PaaD